MTLIKQLKSSFLWAHLAIFTHAPLMATEAVPYDLENPHDLVDISLGEESIADKEQKLSNKQAQAPHGKWKKRLFYAGAGLLLVSGGGAAGMLLGKTLRGHGSADDTYALSPSPSMLPSATPSAYDYGLSSLPNIPVPPLEPSTDNSTISPIESAGQIVDLSKELAISSKSVTQKLIDILDAKPEVFKHVRGIVILQNGEIIGEHYIKGRVQGRYPIWSCTKSWISTLIGVMEKEGLINLNERLVDIWPENLANNNSIWSLVTNAKEKKQITVEDLLTFSAGYTNPGMTSAALSAFFDNGRAGGVSIADAMNYDKFEISEQGSFNYPGPGNNILSYIIKERTGLNPLEYAKSKGNLFDQLNINAIWDSNSAEISYSGLGLKMRVRDNAKLGQLFLQGGVSAPGLEPLISQDWIDRATSLQVPTSTPDVGYGYLWRVGLGDDRFYTAIGAGGQIIFVLPEENRVISISSDIFGTAFQGLFNPDLFDEDALNAIMEITKLSTDDIPC